MKLLLVGDVMLGRQVNQVLAHASPEFPWGDTLPLFQAADFRICNLECVISDLGRPWSTPPKVFHFRSDARNVAVLKAAGIDAVSIANNHTLDYEYDALFEMLKVLDNPGIGHAGAGANFADAARPTIHECGGLQVGLMAFSNNEPDWESSSDRPGIFYVPIDINDRRAIRLFELVRLGKKSVNYLIVSAHWGPNWGRRPESHHVPFAHALIDAGADIVFGHSGHVFQGIEIYQNRPILYCTGDFIDDYAVDEIDRNDQSFIFRVETEGNRTRRLRLHPTLISGYRAVRADPASAEQMAGIMQALCHEFGTVAEWRAQDQCLEIALT